MNKLEFMVKIATYLVQSVSIVLKRHGVPQDQIDLILPEIGSEFNRLINERETKK